MAVLAVGSRNTFDVILADIHIVVAHDIVLALFAGTEEHLCAIGEQSWVFDSVVGDSGLVHGAQYGYFASVGDSDGGSFYPDLCSTFGNSGYYAIGNSSHFRVGATPLYGLIHRICGGEGGSEGRIVAYAEGESGRVNGDFFDHHIGYAGLIEAVEGDGLHITACVVERIAWGRGVVCKEHFVVVLARGLADDLGIAVLYGDGKVGGIAIFGVQITTTRGMSNGLGADIEVPVGATFLEGDNGWFAEGDIIAGEGSGGDIDVLLGVGEASANVVLVGIAQDDLVAILQGSRISDLDKCLSLERKHARKSEKEKNLFHVILFFLLSVFLAPGRLLFSSTRHPKAYFLAHAQGVAQREEEHQEPRRVAEGSGVRVIGLRFLHVRISLISIIYFALRRTHR